LGADGCPAKATVEDKAINKTVAAIRSIIFFAFFTSFLFCEVSPCHFRQAFVWPIPKSRDSTLVTTPWLAVGLSLG
jgi:hypothetical protein